MNNEYVNFKQQLLSYPIFKKVSNGQYKVKECPYCGDTKYHMYVKISLIDDSPVVYHCFKCLKSDVLKQDFLEYYGISNLKIPRVRTRKKIDESRILNVDTIYSPNDTGIDHAISYIESRVGVKPTLEEMKSFQYISNPIQYINDYLSFNHQISLNNRYWFKLTSGNIIGRWIDDDTDQRWLKLSSNNIKSTGIYNIKVPFDLYEQINVYIAEGIMDVIGLYYHHIRKNSIYIATLGKNYELGLRYLINRGIFGKSVNVHIFKDSDVKTENIHVNKHLAQLFNSVELYMNADGHDFGVSQFTIQKCLDWSCRKNGRCKSI